MLHNSLLYPLFPFICTVFIYTYLSALLLVNNLIFMYLTTFQVLKQVLEIPKALTFSMSTWIDGLNRKFPSLTGGQAHNTLLSIWGAFIILHRIGFNWMKTKYSKQFYSSDFKILFILNPVSCFLTTLSTEVFSLHIWIKK